MLRQNRQSPQVFLFHSMIYWFYICNVIFVIFVFHHLTIMKYFFVHSVIYRFYISAVSYLSFIIWLILFCKQHCHQETLKSRFQSSTFCRFYASSYFDKVYIRIACSTLFINKISPILSRCSFLVKVRCPVSRESVWLKYLFLPGEYQESINAWTFSNLLANQAY